ncbi:GAF domain-containing SpoIIE family protein phosphatase [Nocardioides sp. W7]|uniref:PP2C family protein-serine/threonine phosphatase n=1 Tax=Nocardioides sp. W7 TaxID=2931390 RepID=UPI001FD179F8|nr:GAF domain-containing SpoIIE family protein phosphatase [Nocardioides sp. W7]
MRTGGVDRGPVSAHPVAQTASGDRAETIGGLSDVLDGVRAALGADTATVLVLDGTRSFLEPLATVGLGRMLHAARRVPFGHGFAGRIAQSRQPVVLSQVDRSTVINPVLLDHGVQSLLGVPVMDGSELLGVLHVGYLHGHVATEAETRLLSQHAATLGAGLHDRFADDAHTAALTLQRSLLPTTVTAPEGISIAARYVPAHGDLGGDWYDVFELPGDRLAIVMGDVAGHGLEAAVVMGRLRSALRAYALEHDDPAEVLMRLDRKICHFEQEVFATVVLGIAHAPYTEWCLSTAGHHPPVVGSPGAQPVVAAIPQDPLLGFQPETARRSVVIEVPAGGFLCLYTDGLVERRPTRDRTVVGALDENMVRLVDVLGQPGDPEMRCIRALSEVVGDQTAEDDIAILVAQVEKRA